MTGELLMKLGLTPNYHGYQQVELAVELARREPNVRSVAAKAWENNPALFCELAGYPMKKGSVKNNAQISLQSFRE